MKKYNDYYYKAVDLFNNEDKSINNIDISNSFGYNIELMHNRSNKLDRNTLKSRDNFINSHNIFENNNK